MPQTIDFSDGLVPKTAAPAAAGTGAIDFSDGLVPKTNLTPEQQATLATNVGPDAAAALGPNLAAPGEGAKGVGQGFEDIYGSTVGAVTHPIDTAAGLAKTVWNASPGGQFMSALEETMPVLHAYEDARSKGASIGDALKAGNDAATQIFKNKSAIEQAVQAFHAHPTRTAARAITDAAGLIATMYLGSGASEAAPADATAMKPPVSRLRVNPFEAKVQQATAKVASAAGVPEGAEATAVRAPAQRITVQPETRVSAPAQRITVQPPTTRTVPVPSEEGHLVLSPEDVKAHEQVQSMATARASEQGMRSAANMPRMGSVEGLPGTAEGAAGERTVTEPGKVVPGKEFMTGYGDNPTMTTPARIVPGKEFLTSYADNPTLEKLPETEGVALESLIRDNVKPGKVFGANVDWNGALKDFDGLGAEGQKARFANPSEIRAAIRRQATIQSVKNLAVGTSEGLGALAAVYDLLKSRGVLK